MKKTQSRAKEARGFTMVELVIVAIVLLLAMLLVAPLIRREIQSRGARTCIENLTKIDGAKEQWALEHNQPPGEPVSDAEIVRPGTEGYLSVLPSCPLGGTYAINAVGTDPECATGLPGHQLSEVSCVNCILE